MVALTFNCSKMGGMPRTLTVVGSETKGQMRLFYDDAASGDPVPQPPEAEDEPS